MSAQTTHPRCPQDALSAAGPAGRIRRRLRRALRLLADPAGPALPRCAALVRDALDRLRAWELTRLADAACSQVRPALLTRDDPGGGPVHEFLLLPFGRIEVERPLSGGSFEFTRAHAEALCGWFEKLGRSLAIDYEHQSFEPYNTRPDGLRPAAGWIGGLEIRDDGLWATQVTWTPRATELLRSGEYRYFSPVIYWADEQCTQIAGLGPVALTNDPAICGVRPLAAGRRAPDDAGPPEGFVPPEVHAEALAQIDLLRRQLREQQADAFVERGMRMGKIVDSTSMDWRADYLRDPQAAEERLARAAVVLPPGRLVGAPLPPRDRTAADPAAREFCRRWGVTAEDLAAYEQALRAGRVRQYGIVPRT